MTHQFFNKTPKTGTAKPNKIEKIDFYLSLSNPAHSEVLASIKL